MEIFFKKNYAPLCRAAMFAARWKNRFCGSVKKSFLRLGEKIVSTAFICLYNDRMQQALPQPLLFQKFCKLNGVFWLSPCSNGFRADLLTQPNSQRFILVVVCINSLFLRWLVCHDMDTPQLLFFWLFTHWKTSGLFQVWDSSKQFGLYDNCIFSFVSNYQNNFRVVVPFYISTNNADLISLHPNQNLPLSLLFFNLYFFSFYFWLCWVFITMCGLFLAAVSGTTF